MADGLIARANAGDVGALMDLSTLLLLTGDRDNGLSLQAQAIQAQRLYVRKAERPGGLRLLALMAAGDTMANTPLDFLLEGSDIELVQLYVDAEHADRSRCPTTMSPSWRLASRRPIARDPAQPGAAPLAPMAEAIAQRRRRSHRRPDPRRGLRPGRRPARRASRPPPFGVDRQALSAADRSALSADHSASRVAGRRGPRQAGSRRRPARLSGQPDRGVVLRLAIHRLRRAGRPLSCKQRIALIDGRPFVCHLAVSPRWMVHYMNADMAENPANRAEEAAFMADFDDDFGRPPRRKPSRASPSASAWTISPSTAARRGTASCWSSKPIQR